MSLEKSRTMKYLPFITALICATLVGLPTDSARGNSVFFQSSVQGTSPAPDTRACSVPGNERVISLGAAQLSTMVLRTLPTYPSLNVTGHSIILGTGLISILVIVLIYIIGKERARHRKLKHLVKEQTEEILAQNQRLEQLDRSKSMLYTNITHEFRTPLTVILGMAERLDSSLQSEGNFLHRKKLRLISRNGRNLLQLINQMLDLSKIESNGLHLNNVNSDIIRYVRYITESFHSLANAHNIMLQIRTNKTGLQMDFDPEKFRQILANLLSNAMKYTSSGGKVTVRVDTDARPGQPVEEFVLKVEDTGYGIPPEDLPKIFDRFYRSSDQIAKAGGTGIGLALTKELITLMHGTIEVKSKLGVGTTFTVRLPISRDARPQAKIAGQIESPIVRPGSGTILSDGNYQARPENNQAPRLLIVEDSADVVDFLGECLEGHFRLEYAFNGRIGIERALGSIPDIILSDVMMPEKDGFDLCEALKNDQRTSHIPIVLLTARADRESRVRGLRHGADAYLQKPFNRDELMVTLENLLEMRQKLQQRFLVEINPVVPSTSPRESLDPEELFLLKVRETIEKNLPNTEFGIPQLCRTVGLSRSQIHKKIKALTGLSTSLYWRSIRLEHARNLLLNSDHNVSEVAYLVGFSDPKYFSRLYAEKYRASPSMTRKKVSNTDQSAKSSTSMGPI